MAAALATAGVLVRGLRATRARIRRVRARVRRLLLYFLARDRQVVRNVVANASLPRRDRRFLYDVPRFAVPASFSHILRVAKERLIIRDKSRSNIPPHSRDDPAVIFFLIRDCGKQSRLKGYQ